MYLKSIDMYGFKSFAQKMSFKFDEGITGIVGPNGSGKSNIADAVRWVLGEQSAKMLRGAKMQDIIFAGTETRKPLGYCQVDLTIDNTDMKMPIEYTEVTVSRRVYRSGEGEYYINGVECRLKDVQELFMDTGVGKEGYSIIGQGQIDLILSTKPDDRRELFDEAAGIVKFKKRKASAEKNLEEEKQNLVRINDILRELGHQQSTLQGQAEIAKEYLKYKEELKKYEVNTFINEAEKLILSIKEIDDKETVIQNQIDDIKLTNEQIKDQYNTLNTVTEELEKEIDEFKITETQLAVEKEKKESNIDLIKEQINSLNLSNERINHQNEELKEKVKRNDFEKNGLLEQVKALLTQRQLKEAVLLKDQEAFESLQKIINEDEAQIESIQTNRIERLNEISTVKTKIQRFHTMLENMEARSESLNSRKQTISLAQVDIDHQVQSKISFLDDRNQIKRDNQQRKLELNQALLKGEEQKKAIEYSIKSKTEQLQMVKSKYNALNELTDQYEGYNLSIKKIMELKKLKSHEYEGVLGVVADIVEVNKEYETAIEIALGGNVQNIVTDHENTAKKLIEYLRYNKLGRATFLPLTSIKNRENKLVLNNKDAGFIGYASDLVNYDPKYKNIIEFLLGRIVIVDNMDNAIMLAKKHQYSLRIVTLSGDQVNPGGSLTGGAYKNQNNQFLSRKRDLEQYEKNINIYTNELAELEEQHTAILSSYTKNKNNLEALTQSEYELNLVINSETIALKQLENETNKYNEDKADIDFELSEIERQEEQIKSEARLLETALDGTNVENDEAELTVKRLSDEIQSKKAQKDILSEELTKIRVDVSSVKQQLDNVKENAHRIERDIRELSTQIETNIIEINKEKLVIQDKLLSITSLENEMKMLEEKLVINQCHTQELQQKKHSLTQEQHLLYKQREEQNEQISILEKDILRLQNSKIKYEMQRDTSNSYMWNEYRLTYQMSLSYKDDSLGSITNIKKMISELKDTIKALGDVNVNAIEEYKVVSERFTFLTDQRNDLTLAEEKLKKVIADLYEQMERQFREKFKEIAIKFNEVFRELFGGGKAILELTEGENILEAGIDINAQPPGKKLQSMRLLSGGEKAFTAISLLFAIQSLKPSPFCVLDEIEAALDDANVTRFANYLNKLTKNTQFIIITHRRGTMEVADSLYGITMQEKGISTQVSVKLLENDIR